MTSGSSGSTRDPLNLTHWVHQWVSGLPPLKGGVITPRDPLTGCTTVLRANPPTKLTHSGVVR